MLFRVLVFLLVCVGLLAATTGAHAQEATPTPTPSPVATSTITIRFVQDGEPVTITLGQAVNRILADGVECFPGVPPVVVEASGYTTTWPLPPDIGQSLECTKGPPTSLRFEFASLDFGLLVAEFEWQGTDITFDVEVPASAGQLPRTGGAPLEGVSAHFIRAQEATPTPTPSPVPTSTITIRFVQDGEPVMINGGVSDISADGADCLFLAAAGPELISEFSLSWPLPASTDQPSECSKGPPTMIRIAFFSGSGPLVAEFEWNGEDVSIDIEVRTAARDLPPTGGEPVNDSDHFNWLFPGIAIASLTILLLVTSLSLRRPSK